MQSTAEQKTPEKFKVQGSQIIDQVKRLIHEGNVRRIIISHDDRTIVEIPLTFGVVATALAPELAAVGAVAALVTECAIEVQREPDTEPTPQI